MENSLTDEELAKLPEKARAAYQFATVIDSRKITYLCKELLRALTPQPCGHPGACVVSVPYIGENKSNVCGWCDGQAHDGEIIEAMREKLKAEKAGHSQAIDTYEANWARCLESTQADLDAANERLKHAKEQRAALREKLKAAEGLAEALKQSEWIDSWCPECRSWNGDGHTADCKRGNALAAWKEAND